MLRLCTAPNDADACRILAPPTPDCQSPRSPGAEASDRMKNSNPNARLARRARACLARGNMSAQSNCQPPAGSRRQRRKPRAASTPARWCPGWLDSCGDVRTHGHLRPRGTIISRYTPNACARRESNTGGGVKLTVTEHVEPRIRHPQRAHGRVALDAGIAVAAEQRRTATERRIRIAVDDHLRASGVPMTLECDGAIADTIDGRRFENAACPQAASQRTASIGREYA